MRMLKKALLAAVVLRVMPWAIAQQPVKITDGTNGTAAVKPAATAPVAADIAEVVVLSPNNNGLPLTLPKIINKASANVGGATVKTLTDAITSTTAGNTLIVMVCAGEVHNGGTITLAITETGGSDTFTQATTQAQGASLECSLFYATPITGGVTAVIATYAGGSSVATSIAMETYEVSGLLALTPAVADGGGLGTTASGTIVNTNAVAVTAPNDYLFEVAGVGTATQTITLGGTGTWTNDSGQINPASPNGLFSMASGSQFQPSNAIPNGNATIGGAEPVVVVMEAFKPVTLGISGTVRAFGNSGAAFDAGLGGNAPANAVWGTGAPATGAGAAATASTTAALTVVNVKASAGNVYGVSVLNAAGTVCWLQFYNTAGTPVLGTSVVWAIPIAAGGVVNQLPGSVALGNFTTGIGIGSATTAAGAVACGTNLAATVFYK